MFTKRILRLITNTLHILLFASLLAGSASLILSPPEIQASSVKAEFYQGANDPIITTMLSNEIIALPLVVRRYPFTPAVPLLGEISNADGDGSYTISWSASAGAELYTLEEDDNAGFTSPLTVYSGLAASTSLSGQVLGTYYYRVRATSGYMDSDWSNVEVVTVSVLPLPCPQIGDWVGSTSQNREISFAVENSPQCQIPDEALIIAFRDSCGTVRTSTFMYDIPIVANTFDTGVSTAGARVTGVFTTPESANGSFTYDASGCTASGTWTAVFNHWANASVSTMVVQPDGKILVGGDFTSLLGQEREHIGRLNADGTLDTTFNPGADRWPAAMAVQSDSKIVVGGYFTTLGGQPRARIGRLNPDGSLDATFDPGANDYISALAIQSDGKILVGGKFTELGGQPFAYFARLNPDGSLDETFNPGADDRITGLALQPDGQILVSGFFDHIGGLSRDGIARLNPDGSIDESFYASASAIGAYGFAFQPGGKILLWGYLVLVNGQYLPGIARVNQDGTLDTSFNANLDDYPVYTLVQQSDGKLLIGGSFTTVGGQARAYLARLNADGILDGTFTPAPDDYVRAVAVVSGGQVIAGGDFTRLSSAWCYHIGRLNADGTLDPTFP